MTDHDPPFEPLRPIDPTAPDPQEDIGSLERLDPMAPDPQEDIGTLERLDPDADASARSATLSPKAAVTGTGAVRPRATRDGLALAVALTALLSLSSIAAIGGLVAISMRTDAPSESVAVAPIESAAQLPTIHVGESAQGVEREDPPDRRRGGPAPQAPGPAPAPAQAVSPPATTAVTVSGGGGADKAEDEREGRKDRGRGIGGAWCDAQPGSACDATVGGAQSFAPVGP